MPRPSHAEDRGLPQGCLDTSCWEWLGSTTRAGYGKLQWGDREQYTHRLVMDAPADMVIDHLCRNPACYNPRHLEVVTNYENVARGNAPSAVAMRTNRCIHGHEFTPENTYVKRNGCRKCKACGREATRRYQLLKAR